MRENEQPTASDLNRSCKASPLDRVVQAATTYSRMATPEESDAMLRRVYGDDRVPASESRHRSQTGRAPGCRVNGCPKRHYASGLCRPHYGRHGRTGETDEQLAAWHPHDPRPIPSPAEIAEEMRAALVRLSEEAPE